MKEPAAPLSCLSLLGQEKAKKLLTRTLQKKRLPHSFLFSGPTGVGKTLFARGLAAAINCRETEDKKPLYACGRCFSCRKIAHGNHPDFQVIAPQKGAIKIAQVRQLIQELEYPPYEAVTRVVVLEEVDAMGREAANALLKTLEEPLPGNLLILTADSSQKLLATLASRCQTIPFAPLSLADTVDILMNEGVDAEEARLLARLTSGSPGQALRFRLDGVVPLWQEILASLMKKEVSLEEEIFSVLSFAERMAALGEDLPALFGLFRHWLRDLLLDDQPSLASYCGDFPAGSSKNWSSAELSAKLRALDRAEEELGRNCQRALVCEVLLFAFWQKGE